MWYIYHASTRLLPTSICLWIWSALLCQKELCQKEQRKNTSGLLTGQSERKHGTNTGKAVSFNLILQIYSSTTSITEFLTTFFVTFSGLYISLADIRPLEMLKIEFSFFFLIHVGERKLVIVFLFKKKIQRW